MPHFVRSSKTWVGIFFIKSFIASSGVDRQHFQTMIHGREAKKLKIRGLSEITLPCFTADTYLGSERGS